MSFVWKTWAYAADKKCPDCGKHIMDCSTRCKKCLLTERNKRVRYTMENHPKWKGGRGLTKDGYVIIQMADRKQRKEHVLIAEKVLGRPLRWRKEVVHHINGNKSDNRNSNLLICTQAYHQTLHTRMSRLYQIEHLGGIDGV